MKNDTFSGSDFWERNVMEIDHHKEQNSSLESSLETSQTCTTRLGPLNQKLPRQVQHVWVDKMGKERSTLLQLCAGITGIRRTVSPFFDFQLFRDLFC